MLPTDILTILSDATTTARILDAIADRNGDARFRRAAGLLRGRPGGRPPRADDHLLARMAGLLADGSAGSPEQAARFLARTLPGEQSTSAASGRLARKFRKRAAVKSINGSEMSMGDNTGERVNWVHNRSNRSGQDESPNVAERHRNGGHDVASYPPGLGRSV